MQSHRALEDPATRPTKATLRVVRYPVGLMVGVKPDRYGSAGCHKPNSLEPPGDDVLLALLWEMMQAEC